MSTASFDSASNPQHKSSASDRERFVAQSENWIKRIAAEMPDSFFQAAMSSGSGSGELVRAMMPAQAKTDAQIKQVLLMRCMRTVDRMVSTMPKDLILSTLAAPSDFGALARVMSDPRISEPSLQTDPLAGAVGRSIAHRRTLMEMAGEMLSSAQVADLLGITRQAIDKRRNAHKLLAVRVASDWVYPAFQFGKEDVLTGIEEVLQAHAGDDPWVILDILLAPDEALGDRSLLQAIQQGDAEAVSRHVAQQGGDGYA
ncbi:helix-turn-helix domain-containing protein [Primorskyibacter sp. 2E107]|uniref:helix-turn-helix domain-containing protein n=1 Tax=Primorskyibacter sp. 2E107 TaxID=3403458 RepID=UPI003AF5998E